VLAVSSAAHEYYLDDAGRIHPVHEMGWVKEAWQDISSFDEAMEGVVAQAMVDIFPDEDLELGYEELSDLKAKRYLDIVDGFYLATGVDADLGIFRFLWQDEIFFNMRPDFVLQSLLSNLGERPINTLESAVRDRLIDYHRERDALKYALAKGEIEAEGLYPIEWWIEFWKARGIPALHPVGQDESLKTKELDSLLVIIAALCNYSRIKHDDRGAAGRIEKMTDEIGASVTDDTIRKWLDKIPDALERRMK
jgi:hypothetical protein